MKKFMLITAPISSRSGYGEHARDLFHSFYNSDKFEIKINDVRWGDCPRNALNETIGKDKLILDRIVPLQSINQQPDIYVDIRIPNEFQTWGKFNIGITAGIETNAVSQAWLDGCNKMDLIIVPSKHSKDGFVNTVYDKMNTLPDGKQQKLGELKLEKPIKVLFEGVDLDKYKVLKTDEFKFKISEKINNEIAEDFLFLHVGQWGKGNYGEDRKDISKLVKVFIESFANKKNQPGLLLKVNGSTYSVMDKSDCLNKINNIKKMFPTDWKLPNIYLLHGDLSVDEMNELYNHPKVKTFVSLTHGEGFGRPLLEATAVGLPVIAPNWSGQVDFLDSSLSLLLSGELKPVPKSVIWKDIIIEESKWLVTNESEVYKVLNYAYEKYDDIKLKASQLMDINRKRFSLKEMDNEMIGILEEHLDSIPTQVGLNLPKLKKVGKSSVESNQPKIKLPKLKRV